MLLMTCLFIGIGLVNAQVSKVTGTVTSHEDGLPVVGASVLVKGTTVGTVTDIDGNFTITNVPSSAGTLVVSFIGMKTQEVAVKPVVNVILHSDAEVLDEVMVVAYGTAKKSSFTGSASVVKADEIGKIQTSNAAQALTGKVSGVQFTNASGQPGTTTPTIRIRGISSITAGNSPLIILDGSPYDGDLNNINTQDIESMTVLKDAASNALYGSRGANGVIMITTKRGKSQDAKVTVDAKWGVNTRASRDYDYITDPGQYYEIYHLGLRNYATNAGGYDADKAYAYANANLIDVLGGYNVYSVPEGENLIGKDGKINPNATLGNIVEYNGQEYLLKPDNWLEEAYKSSLRQEYNVSVTGGNEKASFYSSFGYLENGGISPNSDYERLTGRLKADYQANSWLKVGANFSYTHYEANALDEDGSSASSANVFAAATQVAPIYPLYMRDKDGNILVDKAGNQMYDYGDRGYPGLRRPVFTSSNALSDAILNTNKNDGNAMNAVGFFEIRFLKDFKFTSTNSVYLNEARSTNVTNPYYGQYASSNGIITKGHSRTLSYNYQQLLNYAHSFGRNNVDLMVGHESYRTKYYTLSAVRQNMFDPNNHELAGAVTDGTSTSYTTDYNTEGYFFRAQYDYDTRYFLSGSYRRDASSRFHPDNRWGNFWSLGGAWIISKEEWFNTPSWIDLFKIKASYGTQGNDNIGNYLYTNTYNIVNAGGRPAAIPSVMGNKDITWETNGNFNAGVDFEMFGGRFSGTAEFFLRKTSDMLFSFPLPPTYGYTSYYDNIGDMKNIGLEVELNGSIIQTKDFNWDLRLNMTYYKNKVSYLPEERKTMVAPDGTKGYTSGNYFYGEGVPLYSFWMYKYAGINENGEALYYADRKDAEGNIIQEKVTNPSAATQYICGSALPDVYGGFGTTFSYKGIDLSVDFAYQIGGLAYDSDYASAMASPRSNTSGRAIHKDMLNAWSVDNPNGTLPRFQFMDSYTAATSDRFLTNASYLSLQNINLGYTLPAKFTRKFAVEGLRLYMTADNVWLWSKRKGLDPRQAMDGSTTASYYAPIRSISGGITLTF